MEKKFAECTLYEYLLHIEVFAIVQRCMVNEFRAGAVKFYNYVAKKRIFMFCEFVMGWVVLIYASTYVKLLAIFAFVLLNQILNLQNIIESLH